MESIINLIGNIMEIYIANLFYSKFSERRVSKKLFLIINIILVLLQFLNNTFLLKVSALVMFCTWLVEFSVAFLYNNKLLSKIYSSIFLFILGSLSEIIVGVIITTVLKTDISFVQSNLILFAIASYSSRFLSFMIVQMIKYNDKSRKNWLPFSLAIKTIPLPAATFFVMFSLFKFFHVVNNYSDQLLFLISSILLIVANIFVFYIIDKQNDYIETKEKLAFAQTHIKNQINHYEELYQYQKELKTFRHDIKNQTIALLGLMKNKKFDEAVVALENDLSFIDEQQELISVGDPIIDAVINTKIKLAKAKNINIELSSRLVEKIEIDNLELGVLIGNALDNAIEATEKVDLAKRTPITVSLISVDNNISFSVTNPINEDINVNKLSSTKRDKNNHGIGLKSMQAIAEKYNGEIFLSCENNKFTLKSIISNTQK